MDKGILDGLMVLQQEVGDFEDENCLVPLNPAREGHKALFNPDYSGNR